MTVDNSSWTVERDYPHPLDQVFAAWADGSVKVQWFDLSGSDNSLYRSDFRVGGAESFRSPPGVSQVLWVRATLCCRRIDGRWRIVHDHESVPFDPETGLALPSQEPQ